MRHSNQTLAIRRQEVLGEYDLLDQITLFGPAYADGRVATATFIHERAHQLIGSVTTYGTFQRGLVMLIQAAEAAGLDALVSCAKDNLNCVLDSAFDADEGFAMLRERDLSGMLGIPFDEATMPDDYARALSAYDQLFSGYEFRSTGMKLLVAQGIAEAIFNTDVLTKVAPSDLLTSDFDCTPIIEGDQRPDDRLAILLNACQQTDFLQRAESNLDRLITGRIVIDDDAATIDEAIIAAYKVPGVQADQKLKLAFLSGSMAVSDAFVFLGLDQFCSPEEAINTQLNWLNELGRIAREAGMDFPEVRGTQDPNELRGAESVRYAPESNYFEVAWALPDLVARLATKKQLYFFNSPSLIPDKFSREDVDVSFLTTFAIQPNEDGVEVACWDVQLMVPWTKADTVAATAVVEHIIDDVIVMRNETAADLQFEAASPGCEDDTIAILANTDLSTLESLLFRWISEQKLSSVRRVISIGPVTYFELRFEGKPRVFIRVPLSVESGLRSGPDTVNQLLPSTEAVWERATDGILAKVFCHLCELGAFFGKKRNWHEDYVDDLIQKGMIFGFRSLGTI